MTQRLRNSLRNTPLQSALPPGTATSESITFRTHTDIKKPVPCSTGVDVRSR